MKKFILKSIVPALLLIIGFVTYTYLTTGYISSFGIHYIILFIVALVGITLFCGFLEYAQNIVGGLMKGSWIEQIVFIAVALLLIYLYKSTGKI